MRNDNCRVPDTILIEALELSSFIGVPDEERAAAQRLTVSMALEPLGDFRALGDRIENTVDYFAVCEFVKSLGLAGPGQVRVNQAGCLDRCQEGPVIVVYPDETWYTYVDKADIDEIIDEHLVGGRVVERLVI